MIVKGYHSVEDIWKRAMSFSLKYVCVDIATIAVHRSVCCLSASRSDRDLLTAQHRVCFRMLALVAQLFLTAACQVWGPLTSFNFAASCSC